MWTELLQRLTSSFSDLKAEVKVSTYKQTSLNDFLVKSRERHV